MKDSDASAQDLPMNRYRPNLVVSGLGNAFDEDAWASIQMSNPEGKATFSLVKVRRESNDVTKSWVKRVVFELITIILFAHLPSLVLDVRLQQ